MVFKEFIVKKKNTVADIIMTVMLYVAACFIGLVMLVTLMPYNMIGIALLILLGALYGAQILSGMFKKEFEYIITNDIVDVDLIMNKSRRKRLISFTMADTEIIASVKDPIYSEYRNKQYDRRIYATTGRQEAIVYFAVVEKQGKTIVFFEPPHEALEMLEQYSRSKVHIYE